jgi:type IV secretory pathway VirB2 component (pilin)
MRRDLALDLTSATGRVIDWSSTACTHALDPEVLMTLRSPFTNSQSFVWSVIRRVWIVLVTVLMFPATSFAQSPWERAAANLEASFTGPLARSLALVAIVIGGLMFMFGEGGAKRQISGIVFGGGLCLFAVQFLAWLF